MTTRKPLVIDHYTARWDEAMHPTAPDVGRRVRVSPQPDGREWHAFSAVLTAAGLELRWERTMSRLGLDEYRVVRAG